MYEGPEFRHLRFFVAVAEEFNIGKAAEKLNVTQPTLSRTIQQLEDGMREQLFVRSRSGTGLTPAGRAFLPFTRNMLELRTQSIRATSNKHSGIELPLRFGYSPFINHDLVTAAMNGFCELVPEGKIEPTSECSGSLASMIANGYIEAALISLPIPNEDLFVQKICSESILVCLRRDDPLAAMEALPKEVIAERLRILFAKIHHPLFYEKLFRKFSSAGIHLHPSSFVSAPSEMQYLVGSRKGFGLVRESCPLPEHLVARRISDLPLKITTAFICRQEQQRPVLPLLAYNLAQRCQEPLKNVIPKKPVGRAVSSDTRNQDAA